jgi:hypothetical protein
VPRQGKEPGDGQRRQDDEQDDDEPRRMVPPVIDDALQNARRNALAAA